jgi:hypothetical protein
MKLPLLLLHNIDPGQFNNWALLLPPIRSIVKLTSFTAACVLCHPQLHISPCILAKANLAHAQVQSQYLLSLQQRSRICASSGITSALSLRLTVLPHFCFAYQRRDYAGLIRHRVGGLQLLASLAPQDLYFVENVKQADIGCGIKERANTFGDDCSSCCASSDETSDFCGSDGSSINCDRAVEQNSGFRAKRRKE